MKYLLAVALLVAVPQDKEAGFVPLFNGKDLTGWKANESPETFKVEDGKIVEWRRAADETIEPPAEGPIV